MSTDETRRLLAWHAGLEGHDGLDPASISGATATGTGVSDAVQSFLGVLARYNVDLNGAQPSAVVGCAPNAVDRGAAYSVSEVGRMLREAGHEEEARDVETAWNAVLAGDVDELTEHVALERGARAASVHAVETSAQQQWRRDARTLGEVGAVLAQTDRSRIEVRLPRGLAEAALVAWQRDNDEEPLASETYEQRVLRHRAGTLGLIGSRSRTALGGRTTSLQSSCRPT